jgi:aminoglycoside phosphotransferase
MSNNALERLRVAKHRALKVTDVRSKENVKLRAEIERLRWEVRMRLPTLVVLLMLSIALAQCGQHLTILPDANPPATANY